jgi:NADPH-dependent curcumin reductase CurA
VLYVSIDPIFRTWLSGARSYLPELELGSFVPAFGLGRVIDSRGKVERGCVVIGVLEWATLVVKKEREVYRVPEVEPLPWLLSVAGPTGLTAMAALED